jgi:hypothetical protein
VFAVFPEEIHEELLTPLFLLLAVSTGYAQVEYVKVCSIYGAGFYYLAGTDICHNPSTGDTRQQTEGGTWRSLLPYPEGKWVTNLPLECSPGKPLTIGKFKSTDFTLNQWERKQTSPVSTNLQSGEFITKVIMKGGFYDPRLPGDRHGVNGFGGLCVRSQDPDVILPFGGGPFNPPFGNGLLPVGCVANSRIVNMPAAYAISATSAFQRHHHVGERAGTTGPHIYGRQLVVSTDMGPSRATLLTYRDNDGTDKPLAGTLSLSVCVEKGN